MLTRASLRLTPLSTAVLLALACGGGSTVDTTDPPTTGATAGAAGHAGAAAGQGGAGQAGAAAGQGGASAGQGGAKAGQGGVGTGGAKAGAAGQAAAGQAGASAGSAGKAGAGGGAAGAGGGAGASGTAGAGGAGTAGAGGAKPTTEVCNGVDDDLDGQIDEGCDDDLDGFCDAAMMVEAGAKCAKGGGDCDDTDPTIFPGQTAHKEGVDYDCDGKREYAAKLVVTVDDRAKEVCVNGAQLKLGANYDNWTKTDTYALVLESGPNSIGVSGEDTGMVITAMAAVLEVNGKRYPTRGVPGGKFYKPADPEWKATPWRYFPKDASTDKLGWCDRTFDDSAWGPAMRAAGSGSPSFLVGQASPWACGSDLCTAFPQSGADQPEWIWDPYPVSLQTAWIRTVVTLP